MRAPLQALKWYGLDRPMPNPAPARVLVAERIRAAREAHGLSLSKAAERMGITKAALWSVEQGKADPRFSTLKTIGQAYGLTVGQLVDGGDPFSALDPFALRIAIEIDSQLRRAGAAGVEVREISE